MRVLLKWSVYIGEGLVWGCRDATDVCHQCVCVCVYFHLLGTAFGDFGSQSTPISRGHTNLAKVLHPASGASLPRWLFSGPSTHPAFPADRWLRDLLGLVASPLSSPIVLPLRASLIFRSGPLCSV